MATSTNAAVVPLEEYLRTGYRPDRVWIDGELRERHRGEGEHAVLQKFFLNHVWAREEEWGIVALPEQRVQTSEKNYRVPDVCGLDCRRAQT